MKIIFWIGILGVALSILAVYIFPVDFAISGGNKNNTYVIMQEKEVDTTPRIVFVSGTEYYFGDRGQTIIQLLDYEYQKITIADCNVTILYPNKTIFKVQNLSFMTIQGNYWNHFIIPPKDGVYEQDAVCKYQEHIIHNSHTFHVGNATSIIRQDLSNLNISLGNLTSFLNESLNEIENYSYLVYNTTTENYQFITLNLTNQCEVVKNNTDIIIDISNRTYDFMVNNLTNNIVSNITIPEFNQSNDTLIYLQTIIKGDLELIKDRLGIKPFNATLNVFAPHYISNNQFFILQAELLDQYNKIIDNGTCYAISNIWGNKTMTYDQNVKVYKFEYYLNGTTTDVGYSVKCEV